MVSCAVFTCHNHSKHPNPNVHYHSFPKDPKLAKLWVFKCRRKDPVNILQGRVCSEHFLPTDYEDDMKHRLLGLKERPILKKNAVPSVKLSSGDDNNQNALKRAERARKRSILQRALRRLKSLSPKRKDDDSKLEYSDINPQLHSSGIISREEEKIDDPIPLEPAIEIKEEPIEYDPTPSTSTDTNNAEFILPHEENNTWIPAAPETVVEPKFTLSVASLANSKKPETFAEPRTKKRKISKASSAVPITNGSEVRPPSPACDIAEPSSPGSSKELRKDQFDVFGEYIAAKLRSLDRKSCAYAQKAIGDIIFKAEMGKFLDEDSDDRHVNFCAS